MQQYFINQPFESKEFTLNADDSFHIIKVMRKKLNDKVYIAFITGVRYVCVIRKISDDIVTIYPESEVIVSTELPLNVTIAIPPLKSTKLDYLIQKATELGVTNIILFNSERNIAKVKIEKLDNKISRFEKIAKEASEQSKRGIIPNITILKNIDELIKVCAKYNHKLIAYEQESQNIENFNLQNLFEFDLSKSSVLAVFGSEGGFSEKEVNTFVDNGYKTVGLGKRILRAETAPLLFLSCITYFTEIKK